MRRRKARAKLEERLTVGYVRVSSDQQAIEGVSLDAEAARLRAYAAAMGWDLADVIVDAAISAKTTERQGLQRVLRGLPDRSIGRVIVVKLDRLTRSVRDLADLIDAFTAADAALVSLGEHIDSATAAGRLMLNLFGSVAQSEREAIGERTAAALAHKRATGRVYGATLFEYRRKGDELIADEREQHALGIALRWTLLICLFGPSPLGLRSLTSFHIVPPGGTRRRYGRCCGRGSRRAASGYGTLASV